MMRKLLPFAALLAAMLLTPVPGPREPVAHPLPARTAWHHAERMLADRTPPAAEAFDSVVRELEMVCGDPAGALFIERALARWPEFEPARRARLRQEIRHGHVPLGEPSPAPATRGVSPLPGPAATRVAPGASTP